ncbi:MAG: tRNA (adenosine(37)-N6)-threonylcarbamoyltransferase complex dimerization subunit type 1 TsaB [Actinobacteria bacterium]|nr:tRNA (adenosine(37)-N6)-threonylcarbamoyltransferase complex dimerization subunit type 1 TsaB [Actinomycetota bacterium]
MIALALDTATSATVVGLRAPDGTIREARDDVPAGARPRHTQRLLPLAAELLAQAGAKFGDLDLIAVGIGPGTFTGLRIGIATARGLGQATGATVVGLCTLRVLAAGAAAPGTSAPAGRPPAVLALIDAGRGEAFVGGYEEGRELVAPVPVGPDGLAAVAAGRAWLGVGSGALRFRGQLEDADVTVPLDESPLHRVSAATMLGLALDDDVDARGPVTPLYLRLPDAELALRSARP